MHSPSPHREPVRYNHPHPTATGFAPLMSVPLQNVTHACFGLSYLLALGFEAARLRWPRPAYLVA